MHLGSSMLFLPFIALNSYVFCELVCSQNSGLFPELWATTMQLLSAAVPNAHKAVSSLQIDPGICLSPQLDPKHVRGQEKATH